MPFTNYWSSLSFSLSPALKILLQPSHPLTWCQPSPIKWVNWIIMLLPPVFLAPAQPPTRALPHLIHTHISTCWGIFLPGWKKATLKSRYPKLKLPIPPAWTHTHTHTQGKVFLLERSFIDSTTILKVRNELFLTPLIFPLLSTNQPSTTPFPLIISRICPFASILCTSSLVKSFIFS